MDTPPSAKANILVVEDDQAMRDLLHEALSEHGYAVHVAPGGRAGVTRAREGDIDLVITDLRMPDLHGLDLVRELRSLDTPADVITITGFGTIDTAIKAIKLGSCDYITKPFEIDQLLIAVERVLRDRQLKREVSRLREEVADKYSFANIIGRSAAMQEIFRLIRRLSDSPVSVLISGESGTGKELVAKALHFNSDRSRYPFIPVNCAAIPADLLESELFGYKKGAFTDANQDRKGLMVEADQGTLFLDEIGELSAPLQAKLLRVLQEHEVRPLGASKSQALDIRVVSATNQDLEEMLRNGQFRSDLYYRLNVVRIDLPPLRARTEDILPVAKHLLKLAADRSSSSVRSFSPEAAKALMAYPWPGNVRELENVVERAVALSRSVQITIEDLPTTVIHPEPEDVFKIASVNRMTLAELERAYILQVLHEEGGHKTRASQRLGLDRKTLYRKLEEYRRDEDS